MAQSKTTGIDKERYKELQALKDQEDFRYQTTQGLQNLKFDLERQQERLAKIMAERGSDKKDTDIQLQHIMEACMSSLKEFRQDLGDINTQLTNTNNWIKQVRTEIEDCVETSNFNEKISHLHDCIKRLHTEKDSMRKEFNGLIDRLKLDFESRLKTQKEEILAIPSEVPNLRKVMDQKIELVELNGQNAVLRSSNNEKQIMLVERKIDNIYQLIKKLEIANEESK